MWVSFSLSVKSSFSFLAAVNLLLQCTALCFRSVAQSEFSPAVETWQNNVLLMTNAMRCCAVGFFLLSASYSLLLSFPREPTYLYLLVLFEGAKTMREVQGQTTDKTSVLFCDLNVMWMQKSPTSTDVALVRWPWAMCILRPGWYVSEQIGFALGEVRFERIPVVMNKSEGKRNS